MPQQAFHAGPRIYKEEKLHGSALFPFNIYPCTIPDDFDSVPLHWQNSMELIYIKRGAGLAQVALNVMEARAGDIFVLPPGTLHGLRQSPGKRMEYENFIFSLTLLGGADDVCAQQYLMPLQSGRQTLPARLSLEDPGYAAAAACLTDAEEFCRTRRSGFELGVKGAMLRFVALLLAEQNLPPAPPDSVGAARLKKLLQRVEDDCAAPLSVEQAAAECGCSASHFMRWFKKMTGTTFGVYLNERRLATAAELLRTTDDTVLSIAEQAGFENLSNFNRRFKARYGVTPRQYRSMA